MAKKAVSRRTAFGAGTLVLAATAGIAATGSAQAAAELNPQTEAIIRKWYKSWEVKDWHPLDMLLADDFTFSSAAGDDHISKTAFKKQCWETQIDHFKSMDLLHVFGSGNEALVMYVGHTKNDRSFQNVEYLRLKDAKIEFIQCYFGAQSNFPSAVSRK